MSTVWHHRENTEASPLVAILVAYSYSLFEYAYSLEHKVTLCDTILAFLCQFTDDAKQLLIVELVFEVYCQTIAIFA